MCKTWFELIQPLRLCVEKRVTSCIFVNVSVYSFFFRRATGHSFRIILTPCGSHNAFLPRDAMLARHMLSSCVLLSVRMSHSGIVPKLLNLGSRKQHYTIAKGF